MKPTRNKPHTTSFLTLIAGMHAAIQYTAPSAPTPVRDVRLGPTEPELQKLRESTVKQARKAAFRLKQAGGSKGSGDSGAC